MSTLVTGNLGYIGTVLTEILVSRGYEVIGLDIGYFKDCELVKTNKNIKQILKDIRDIEITDLDGVDSLIHLSALSNDPLGEFDPKLTYEINYSSTIKLAKLAEKKGIKRFIYVSSQSMYGISRTNEELDEYSSNKNPLTEYAKTKWKAELELNKLNSKNFNVVSFRPSTVFGASPRLRCDIVFNNLVASAYTMGKIDIKSDGSPWRPVVHIRDVCSALISGLEAPLNLISGKAFNVGLKNGNYTVRQMAEVVKKVLPKVDLFFSNEHSDSRTYKVSFKRIFNELKDYYKPIWTLEKGALELLNFFKMINFTKEDFLGIKTNRLKSLKSNFTKKFTHDLRLK
jgi:nucleoside-diphosphate-sugar epimerase